MYLEQRRRWRFCLLAFQCVLLILANFVAGVHYETKRLWGDIIDYKPELKVFNKFVEVAHKCPEGCTKYGNCNKENGKCECPWDRGGPACEKELFPLCKEHPSANITSCGTFAPKTCECFKQCIKHLCPPHLSECLSDIFNSWWFLAQAQCYILKNTPNEKQISAMPRPEDADWFRWDPQARAPGEAVRPEDQAKRDITQILPASECEEKCNHRGVCARDADGPAYCLCRRGFNGTRCEDRDPEFSCWFSPNCNGHGTCVETFCHCEPGWWGLGCTRSKAYALAPGASPLPSRKTLKIYMYELPYWLSDRGEPDDGALFRDPIYQADMMFMKQFINDWSIRTENPHEAQLFYIPVSMFFYIGNLGDPTWKFRQVVDFIQQEYPYWNITGGRDHFMWLLSDRGPCLLQREQQDSAIKIVHFGLNVYNSSWVDNKDYGCIKHERDIVAVPNLDVFQSRWPFDNKTWEYYEGVLAKSGDDGHNRTNLFFFAGHVPLDPDEAEYSGGIRQHLFHVLNNTKYDDVKFMDKQVVK